MIKDLTGKKFGKLTVLTHVGTDKLRRALWLCQCECGNTKVVASTNLLNGHTTSCGCAYVRNLIGQKFGRLTVIKRAENTKDGKAQWLCQCECGNTVVVSRTHLIDGYVKSCGCLVKETAREKCKMIKELKINNKHDLSKTRVYNVWESMKQRCYNENNPNYSIYGGRGITVCEEWKEDFSNFYDWAINNGYKENLTIDRIDNYGNYEPNNCRWTTYEGQANNRRCCHLIEYNGEVHTISEWAKIKNLSYSCLITRINRLNWSVEKALETPSKKKY